MGTYGKPITILMADDDPEDCMLTEEALEETHRIDAFDVVEDGEELMDYLYRRGAYGDLAHRPLPDLILLDLNMPRKDGREALREIKADPALRRIPVVVLTTSIAEEDIGCTYEAGANSFITKPVRFEVLVEVMKTLSRYWLEIVERCTMYLGGAHE